MNIWILVEDNFKFSNLEQSDSFKGVELKQNHIKNPFIELIDKLKKREYTIDELTKFAQKLGLGITGSNESLSDNIYSFIVAYKPTN